MSQEILQLLLLLLPTTAAVLLVLILPLSPHHTISIALPAFYFLLRTPPLLLCVAAACSVIMILVDFLHRSFLIGSRENTNGQIRTMYSALMIEEGRWRPITAAGAAVASAVLTGDCPPLRVLLLLSCGAPTSTTNSTCGTSSSDHRLIISEIEVTAKKTKWSLYIVL